MMTLDSAVATAQISDRRAAAAAARTVRQATLSPSVAGTRGERVVLRRAQRQDDVALDRLAALDGVRRPAGELLLAEVGGEILAAVPVEGGRAIADPFRPTRDLVEVYGPLEADDVVVRRGTEEIHPGARIQVRNTAAAKK